MEFGYMLHYWLFGWKGQKSSRESRPMGSVGSWRFRFHWLALGLGIHWVGEYLGSPIWQNLVRIRDFKCQRGLPRLRAMGVGERSSLANIFTLGSCMMILFVIVPPELRTVCAHLRPDNQGPEFREGWVRPETLLVLDSLKEFLPKGVSGL